MEEEYKLEFRRIHDAILGIFVTGVDELADKWMNSSTGQTFLRDVQRIR